MSIPTFKINRSYRNPNRAEVKFYQAWIAMRDRCMGKNPHTKARYVDRGISVCVHWEDFENFFIDMWGSYSDHIEKFGKDTELDRINNDKGYWKKNCRWVTHSENQSNKSNTKLFKGKTLAEWARELKINRRTLAVRYYKLGWSIEKTLSHKIK
jgi:hypothetical protein